MLRQWLVEKSKKKTQQMHSHSNQMQKQYVIYSVHGDCNSLQNTHIYFLKFAKCSKPVEFGTFVFYCIHWGRKNKTTILK